MNRLGLGILFASCLVGLVACGTDALVGGTCKPGYVEQNGACVVAPAAPPPPMSDTDPNLPSAERGETSPAAEPEADPHRTATQTPPVVTAPAPVDPVDPKDQPPIPPTDNPPVIEPPPPLTCDAPLVACRGQCIPVDADPRNCGACGRICPSNICVDGECVGATPGDVVMIGHDMHDVWAASAHAKVLTNAVGIPTTEPIRVLSYEAGADAATALWTRFVVQYGLSNRTVAFTTASEDALKSGSLYAQYDVVLVHGAAVSDPADLGRKWSDSLRTFTKKGGVFVGIDGGASDMPSLVSAAELMPMSGHIALDPSMHFAVSGPNDVVGRNLLSPYAAFGASVAFVGLDAPSANLTYVVQTDDEGALPVVLHRVAR